MIWSTLCHHVALLVQWLQLALALNYCTWSIGAKSYALASPPHGASHPYPWLALHSSNLVLHSQAMWQESNIGVCQVPREREADQWTPLDQSPDHLGAQGLYPSGTLAHSLWKESRWAQTLHDEWCSWNAFPIYPRYGSMVVFGSLDYPKESYKDFESVLNL
jgi:hypothetical protein